MAQLHDDVLEVVALGFVVLEDAKSGNGGDPIPVTLVVAPVACDELVEFFKIGQTHGGRDLRHLSVRPRVDHVVVAGEAEVAHEPHLFGQRVVVGYDGPAFEGVEEFRRVKAEYLAFTESAEQLAAEAATESM